MPRRRPPDGVSLRSINRAREKGTAAKCLHAAERVVKSRISCVLATGAGEGAMIRKLKSGEYRLYSRKKHPKTGKRRNLGTFKTREAAQEHEKAVQFFKRKG
jgi:hypothetical protein